MLRMFNETKLGSNLTASCWRHHFWLGWTFWVDIPVFYGQKSIHFCWWSPHFCWNPSFSCGFFPRWKVKVPHLSLVKSWEIHHKKLAVSWNPTVCSQVDLGISASVTVNARPSELEIPGDLLLRTGQPLRNAGGAEIPGGHSAWRPDINGGMVWTPLKDIEPCTQKYYMPITSYTFYMVWGFLGIICCLQVFDGLYLRVWRSY